LIHKNLSSTDSEPIVYNIHSFNTPTEDLKKKMPIFKGIQAKTGDYLQTKEKFFRWESSL
jgi:hypothetical protein